MCGYNSDILSDLTVFIKKNKQLIHIDLTATNLTEYMIWKLGSSLRRAKSIASIHFSNNQCFSEALKQQLFNRISCKELKPERKIGLDSGLNDKVVSSNPALPNKPISTSRMSALVNRDRYMKESMLVRRYKKKSHETREEKAGPDQSKLILERNIGHKRDLPGYG